MNRRAFLGFLGLAPVGLPVVAKAAVDQAMAGNVAERLGVVFGGSLNFSPQIEWGEWGEWKPYDISSLSRWDRDTFAFNRMVSETTETVARAGRSLSTLDRVIDKAADAVVDAVARIGTEAAEPAAPEASTPDAGVSHA